MIEFGKHRGEEVTVEACCVPYKCLRPAKENESLMEKGLGKKAEAETISSILQNLF